MKGQGDCHARGAACGDRRSASRLACKRVAQPGRHGTPVRRDFAAPLPACRGPMPGLAGGFDDASANIEFDDLWRAFEHDANWCCMTWGEADEEYRAFPLARSTPLAGESRLLVCGDKFWWWGRVINSGLCARGVARAPTSAAGPNRFVWDRTQTAASTMHWLPSHLPSCPPVHLATQTAGDRGSRRGCWPQTGATRSATRTATLPSPSCPNTHAPLHHDQMQHSRES